MTTSSTHYAPTLIGRRSTRPADALHRVWGFSEFRPLQREAMHAVLDARDSVVVLPTGGGKSLCFQAPAVVDGRRRRRPSRLRAGRLAADLADEGSGRRPARRRRRGVVPEQHADCRTSATRCSRACATDRCRLLYVSPERLVGEGSQALRRLLQQCGVRVHRHRRGALHQPVGARFPAGVPAARTAARRLSRRLVPRVHRDRDRARPARHRHRAAAAAIRWCWSARSIGRTSSTACCAAATCTASCRRSSRATRAKPGIVYCSSRREVEALAEWLRGEGHRAVPYHAGLPDEVRSRHQEQFLDERVDIVVATVAFGMGIDRSNVRFVVHAGAPRSPEHYQQESGRAGRDGLPAECVLIYSGGDFVRWRQMLESERRVERERARRCCATWSATPPARAAGTARWSSTSASATSASDCGACDWCLKELDAVADSTTRRAEDPVVRRAGEADVGHRRTSPTC